MSPANRPLPRSMHHRSSAVASPLAVPTAVAWTMPGPSTLIVASTALSVLAGGDSPRVVEALASTVSTHEGEVAWSAALALSRMGSDRAKSTLLDLLDRKFWETGERFRVVAWSDGEGCLLVQHRGPAPEVNPSALP